MSGNQNDQKDHELITTIQDKNKAKPGDKTRHNVAAMAIAWDHFFPMYSQALKSGDPNLAECLLEKTFAVAYGKLVDQVVAGHIQTAENGQVTGVESVLNLLVETGKKRIDELTKPKAGNEEDYKHIGSIKNNDSLALLRLDKEFFSYFDDYARKNYSSSQMDREDIYQDSLLSLIKSIRDDCIRITDSFIFGLTKTARLKTYFMSIAINLLNKWSMRKQTTDLDSIKELDDDPDGDWGFSEEDYKLLELAFAQLDDKCAQILDLWSRKFKMNEIAEIMDLPDENNARVLAFRCRDKLRKIFLKLKRQSE